MGRSRASVERVRTLALDGARAELRGQAELIHRSGIVRAGAVIRSGKGTCGDGGGQSVGSRSRGCFVLDLFVVRCRGARWGGWTRGDDAISRDSTRSSPFRPLHAMNGIARYPDILCPGRRERPVRRRLTPLIRPGGEVWCCTRYGRGSGRVMCGARTALPWPPRASPRGIAPAW
jgi:hypothetical protein